MQAIGPQSLRASDGAPVHYERRHPEQTTLYCLLQQHAATRCWPLRRLWSVALL
jgi:hypothetical protein